MPAKTFAQFKSDCKKLTDDENALGNAVANQIKECVDNSPHPRGKKDEAYERFFENIYKKTGQKPPAATPESITGNQTPSKYRDEIKQGRGDQTFVIAIFYWFSEICEEKAYSEAIREAFNKDKKTIPAPPLSPSAPFEWPLYVSKKDAETYLNKSNTVDDGIWLNPLNHHSIPLIGRDKEINKLNEFIKTPSSFLICALIAPSGAGKTRLVSEWMKPYVRGSKYTEWDAGFVRNRNLSEWKNWQISCNTLIVIDYSYNFDEIAKIITTKCRYQKKYKVRLLVIDHIFPEFLNKDIFWNKNFPDQESIDGLKNKIIFKESPITLNAEKNGSKLLRTILSDSASNSNKKFNIDDKKIIEAEKTLQKMATTLQNPDALRQPLFAALLGQALKNNQDFKAWSRRDLIKHYFDKPRRLPWLNTGGKKDENNINFYVGCYVNIATLLRGVDNELLEENLPYIKEYKNNNFTIKERIEQISKRIISSNNASHISAFEPDILGETFLLYFIRYYEDKKEFALFLNLIQVILEADTREKTIEFIGVLIRIARNIANDDHTGLIKKDHNWKPLFKLVNPKNFAHNCSARVACSIALSKIAYELSTNPEKYSFEKYIQNCFTLIDFDDLFNDPSGVLTDECLDACINLSKFFDIRKNINFSDKYIASRLLNIEKLRPSKRSAIILSAYLGSPKITKKILQKSKSSLNMRDEFGDTALTIACKNSLHSVSKELLKYGADVNTEETQTNLTPLMIASELNDMRHIKLLVKAHANTELRSKNKAGWTASSIARSNGHKKVYRFLQKQKKGKVIPLNKFYFFLKQKEKIKFNFGEATKLPLFCKGNWNTLSNKMALPLLSNIVEHGFCENLSNEKICSVRVLKLNLCNDGFLIEIICENDNQNSLCNLAFDGAYSYIFIKIGSSIYPINGDTRHLRYSLRNSFTVTEHNYSQFLQLYFSSMAGEEGTFKIIDTYQDLLIPSDDKNKIILESCKRLITKATEMSDLNQTEEGYIIKSCITYSNALFLCNLFVTREGKCKTLKEAPLMANLPIIREDYFLGRRYFFEPNNNLTPRFYKKKFEQNI